VRDCARASHASHWLSEAIKKGQENTEGVFAAPSVDAAQAAELDTEPAPMQHFQKPENALRRADELYAVGQKEPALVALHDVLSSKRHRVWQPQMEDVMKRFLTICVEMRKGKAAKDGLIQYRIICQQVNVASMEAVLRHFMVLSEAGAQEALDLAEKTLSDKVESLLDFEDLEAEETPESLMLATIGGSADSKKRTDRQVVTPALKFLWEAYRSVLDILRNNVKLEDVYRETAARAFAFCQNYKRGVEFRRLCEILRNHIQAQTKFDPKWKDREPPTPESLQVPGSLDAPGSNVHALPLT